jgi:hypothetical protein
MKKRMMILAILVQALSVFGQNAPFRQYDNNLNTWLMYFGSHKVSAKWGIHLEAQLRRNALISNPQQLLFRTGVNYYFPNGKVMATGGYAFIQTDPYGGFPVKASFPEHRFWEQLQIKTPLSPVEWISRFRLEQRFSMIPVANAVSGEYMPGDAVYTNRFRLLNRFSIPFKGRVIADKSFYASVYDEFMLNFGKNVAANIFDQNRLYFALGYQFPKVGKLEMGYLSQIIQKPDGVKIERNHTLQLGFTSAVDFFKNVR